MTPQEAHASAVAERQKYLALYDGIPPSLRLLPSWGFYTGSKRAVSCSGALRGYAKGLGNVGTAFAMHHNDRATHATFAQVLDASTQNISSSLIGPTLSLQPEYGLVCLDLDDPMRSLPAWCQAHGKDSNGGEARAYTAGCEEIHRITMKWAYKTGAWIEFSTSGKGIHIFVFATLSEGVRGYEIGRIGSIITRDQHVHMTGKKHPRSADDVPHAQSALDEYLTYMISQGVMRPVATSTQGHAPEGDYGRSVDLSDEEVMARMPSVNKKTLAFLTQGIYTNWDRDCFYAIGDLDKITGDRGQVERILFASYALKTAGENHKGVDRNKRTERLFDKHLAAAHEKNNEEFTRRESIAALADQLQQADAFKP